MSGTFETYLLYGFVFSILSTVAALAIMAAVVVTLPADYCYGPAPRPFLSGRHPLVRRTGVFLKNLLGAVLVGVGVVLSVPGVPGPGILTLMMGVMLIDLPEKRSAARWLVSRPILLGAINRLRRRYGKSPLARGR